MLYQLSYIGSKLPVPSQKCARDFGCGLPLLYLGFAHARKRLNYQLSYIGSKPPSAFGCQLSATLVGVPLSVRVQHVFAPQHRLDGKQCEDQ